MQDTLAVTRAVAALLAADDLRSVMKIVKTSGRPLLAADGITFVLRAGDLCHYADEDAIAPLWKGRRFPMGSCVSGWVMAHGRPAVIADVFADPRVPADAYRPTFVKSMAMVPVGTGTMVAAIGAYWAAPHAATRDDVEILEALAGAAAIVLEETCPRCHLRDATRPPDPPPDALAAANAFVCSACDYAWA